MLEGLSLNPQNIYPKIAILKECSNHTAQNILKVQSESSKFSNLEQIFIFTENCHFSYPLDIVQINIFEDPKIYFPNQNPRSQPIEPVFLVFLPGIFNYSQYF